MSELQEVFKRLTRLTPAELEQVRQRLQLLAPMATARDVARGDWLQDGIVAELRRRGVWAKGASAEGLARNYLEKSKAARAHILAGYAKETPRQAELLALGQLSASALASWLVRVRVPVRPRTMFSNVDKIPEALEDAFPGYWKARLLGACVEGGKL